MKLNRTTNTKRNIIVGEIDKLIGILCPFIVRTMIIRLMAAEYLGLMSLFYSIVQMLNFVELGFGTAIIYSMYMPIAEDNTKKINALLLFYKKTYQKIGLLVGAAGLLIMFILPYLITGKIPEDINIYLLYLIFLGNTCSNYFLFPNKKALLTAYQRDDLSGKVHIITQLVMYVFQIIVVYMARDFYLYALTIPISSIAYSILCGYQAKKYYPQYYESGQLEENEYKEIKKQVIGLTVRKIATLSRNSFDSMFISAFLGLGITAIYGNYYYVMDAVIMVLAVVKTSMAGGVGNSIATETVGKNLRDMNTINFLFMWISGWCSVCLLCLYQPFMEIWAGTEMMFPVETALLFAVYFYVLKMGDIRTLYAEAVGIWWQARYLAVAEALVNLLLNYLFVKHMGVFGIIIATLLSYLVFNFFGGAVVLFRNYFTEGGLKEYLLSNLKYMLGTMGVMGVTYMCTERIPMDGWIGLCLKGLVCVILPGILYVLLYYRTKEFKNSIPLMKVVFGRNISVLFRC